MPRYALLSVSNKTGLTEFARQIHDAGFELLSTGGTAQILRDSNLPVTEVADITGFPEIMDGRVKTLQPKIHGALLGRRGIDDAVMAELDIPDIQLLVLNLYPFEQTISDPDCHLEDAIEQIDIGGPAMLRAAAKNFAHLAVVTAPEQYDAVAAELAAEGEISASSRFKLSVDAFNLVSRYDAAISDYLSSIKENGELARFPKQSNGRFLKRGDLRYGENPHQQAAWYQDLHPAPGSLVGFKQLQGKELSFNNLADADAAWLAVRQFQAPACVIVKHANPCGVAVAENITAAYQQAFATDRTSAFGGIIAFNQALDADTAKAIIDQQFVEVLIAPEVSDAARDVLAQKKNVRVLEIPLPANTPPPSHQDVRRISSGLLLQTADNHQLVQSDCRVVSQAQPTDQQWQDLLFAWKVAHYVKSNAIVYAANGQTLGIGAGQMSRIDSARIAKWKAEDAGFDLTGAAMASDAFFPFRDGIDTAAEAGIKAVIQPGGSMRDEEVISATDEHGMVMVFTGIRHFRH